MLCLLYGHPCLAKRKQVWDNLGIHLGQLQFPTSVVGDFNQILGKEDKLSSSSRVVYRISWLKDFVRRLGLYYVRAFGVHFT